MAVVLHNLGKSADRGGFPFRLDLYKGDLQINAKKGSADIAFEHGFNIYPNPTSGNITVELPESNEENITVSLFDLSGKQIDFRETSALAREVRFDLKNLPAGVYLVQMKSGHMVNTQKVVKQ